jgi:Transposase
MESTGVYWIPVWNVLERGFSLTLVNPATVRALQGQKTDRIDARRIAEYLPLQILRERPEDCLLDRRFRLSADSATHARADRVAVNIQSGTAAVQ